MKPTPIRNADTAKAVPLSEVARLSAYMYNEYRIA